MGSWQAKNWDPKVGSTEFEGFCEALGKPPFGISAANANAPYGDPARMIKLPGGLSLDFAVLNYAKYIKDVSVTDFNDMYPLVDLSDTPQNHVSQCPESVTVEDVRKVILMLSIESVNTYR